MGGFDEIQCELFRNEDEVIFQGGLKAQTEFQTCIDIYTHFNVKNVYQSWSHEVQTLNPYLQMFHQMLLDGEGNGLSNIPV